ncbi:hypothetical protein [Paenarthrobacter aurescens]|uniref:hypothetical protein n=1 Tax=Paenarthrobacter aurescens TaxID=43663 RepID=UPI0021C09182|nr:hypothetical protein [Paenarthrobacter aurescens]MCT9868356.1 hypothetical protein [Paenarthrobacter aurescens]
MGPRFGNERCPVVSPTGVILQAPDENVGQLDVESVEPARQVIPELANDRLRAAA